jgi:hypothetical protein
MALSDLDRQPRPFGALPDLGADEWMPCTPVESLDVLGPATGKVGQVVVFQALAAPPGATPNVRYTWRPEPVTGQGSAAAAFRSPKPGLVALSLEASNCGTSLSHTWQVEILPVEPVVYLPFIIY